MYLTTSVLLCCICALLLFSATDAFAFGSRLAGRSFSKVLAPLPTQTTTRLQSTQSFDEFLQGMELPVLVDFYAQW